VINNLEHKIFRRSHGSIESERWYLDDKQHRLDGPAVVRYYEDGSIYSKQWWVNGKRHRLDGPAQVWYHENGSISSECWRLYDNLHRLDGPAQVWYSKDGSIESERWYLDGKELTEEEVEDIKIKLEVQQQIDRWFA